MAKKTEGRHVQAANKKFAALHNRVTSLEQRVKQLEKRDRVSRGPLPVPDQMGPADRDKNAVGGV